MDLITSGDFMVSCLSVEDLKALYRRPDMKLMPARVHIGCWSELLLCLHDVGAI